EIDLVEAGGNYGWSILEGTRCMASACDAEGMTPPVHEYAHEEGRCAAVGGVVYRGEAIEGLDGRYLFGDLCSGEIWALPRDLDGLDGLDDLDGSGREGSIALLADLDGMLVTFGVDEAGEVLVADHQGGGVYRLVEDPE